LRFTTPLALLLLLMLPAMALLGFPRAGWERRRGILSLVIRLLITACLVLSLAGLEIIHSPGQGGALAVVFLVDVSDSMSQAARGAALDYVKRALQAMGPDDEAAVILFGGEALVERPMSTSKELVAFTSIPETSQTDLEEAIQLALALYPADKARRMVILSDGAATTGDALTAARLAAASGVELTALPILAPAGAEVVVSAVEAPASLRQGDRFTLNLTLEATQPTRADVRVLSESAVIFEGSYELKRGSQTFSLPLTAELPGFARYLVQVTPELDTFYQNNERSAYALVAGPPRVLLVAPKPGEPLYLRGETRPDEAAALFAALQAAGFTIERALPYDLPSELPSLAQYAAVALVDVPARQLTDRQMEGLQVYVRELGGGLLVIGGPTSYGVGGYYRTPLETLLPVEIMIKDEQKRPSLAIVFIIDHSGSMSETSGGVTKLELAKEAAMRSIELLTPGDRVGVIAFDDLATWVVPMTDLDEPEEVVRRIATLRPGGGTDILAGLQAMAEVLPAEIATARHVILLTDGGANPAGIPELVSSLNQQYGITLTTVGVGRDAAPFLPQLAELGGGRYHFAENPASIPSIFTEETSLATRAYLVEEPFFPRLKTDSPILNGIDALPQLYGYVGASPKDSAQTILVTHQDDPLLASWRYGLGKVVAFTSDASGRWAKDWLEWEGFATFWAQSLRFTLGNALESAVATRVTLEGERAHLVVEAAEFSAGAELAGFLNGLSFQANILAPDGVTQTITLKQTAPGKYEGNFSPGSQGAYLIHLSGERNDPAEPNQNPVLINEIHGWVLDYSPEYLQVQPDPDQLARLVLAASGKLASSDPERTFEHTLKAPRASRPAWRWLLLMAAMLLPLDIAVRRLTVTRRDIERLAAHLQQRLRPSQDFLETSPRQEKIENLLKVKERARLREKLPQLHEPAPQVPSPAARPIESPKQAGETSEHPASPSSPPPPPGSSQSTAAALLAKKKARKN